MSFPAGHTPVASDGVEGLLVQIIETLQSGVAQAGSVEDYLAQIANLIADAAGSGTTYPLSAAQGGTGVANNAASTLTISGNFGTTLTVSGATTLTLPTTGTVATRAGAEALTNKTYNGNTFTTGTGVLTIAAAKTLTVSNTLTLAGTDGTTMTFPATSATLARTDAANAFTGASTATGWTLTTPTLAGVITVPIGGTTSAPTILPAGGSNSGIIFGTRTVAIVVDGVKVLNLDGNNTIQALSDHTNGSAIMNMTARQITASNGYAFRVTSTGARVYTGANLSGTAESSIGGSVANHTTASVSTTSTNGTEDDLFSNTLWASTLGTNGDSIMQTEHVSFVSSATASRRLKKYFGGTLIFDSGSLTLSLGGDFSITTEVFRESSSVVRCVVTVASTSASSVPYVTYTRITGLTLSATQILKTTGIASGTGAASADIVNTVEKTRWEPAAP